MTRAQEGLQDWILLPAFTPAWTPPHFILHQETQPGAHSRWPVTIVGLPIAMAQQASVADRKVSITALHARTRAATASTLASQARASQASIPTQGISIHPSQTSIQTPADSIVHQLTTTSITDQAVNILP